MKFVYIIGFGNPEMVKIGVSCDPFKRVRNVVEDLEIDTFTMHISCLQKNPFYIESKCHKSLSDFILDGFGPNKKYKREIFKCSLEEAKEVLNTVINSVNK